MKIYERKTSCGSKYNIYDYYEQAHCHTSQLGQALYKVFSFSHLSTDNFSTPFLIATLQDLNLFHRKKYQMLHQKVFGPMMYICGVRFATHLSRKSEIVMCEHSGSRLELNRAFHSNVCSSQSSKNLYEVASKA